MFMVQPDYWGGNNFWPANPYNATNGGPCAIQNDFFAGSRAKATYQKNLRYWIAPYRGRAGAGLVILHFAPARMSRPPNPITKIRNRYPLLLMIRHDPNASIPLVNR